MIALLLPVGAIILAGFLVISSVSLHLFFLQLIWVLLGVALVFVLFFVDWRPLCNYRWLISGLYVVTVVLLLVVYFGGPVIRQVKGWLTIGFLNFQPAELAKVALILIYARYFSRRHLGVARWENIAYSFILFAIPAGLVIVQPDLGSAVVLFGIWFGFLLLSGLPARRILVSFLVFAAASIFLWFFVFHPYQRERIAGFFYPQKDVLGINYSVNQSKIAIGSAGFWGKGYDQGTQTQLGFLSEPANDFILAALIEEWGLFGGLVVVAAFLFLIFAILKIGMAARQNFEKFVCLGSAVALGINFILNIGSTVGLTPVVGVTFPFLSYGGSSIITNFFLIAIINSIRKNL